MPCDSITTQAVVLEKGIIGIVESAMQGLGWNIQARNDTTIVARTQNNSTVRWEQNVGVNIRGYGNPQNVIDSLTQAYSKEAVSWAAQRAGWTVNQTEANKLTITRR